MAIETLAARTRATPLRIRRVQKITLTLLFIAGIVNFLDRSSLSVAGEAIRADLGLSATEFGVLLSAFSLSYGFAQLPSGILLDRLGPRIVLGAGLIFWSAMQALTGMVKFVLAFYSAAHWPRDRRSAVYASRREIDQRLVCAKRARHGGGNIQLLDGAGPGYRPAGPGHHAVGLGLANDVCGDWFSRDRGRPVLVCGLP